MTVRSVHVALITSVIIIVGLCNFVSAVSDPNQTAQIDGNLTNYSVNITNFAFDPQNLNVTVNSSVTWTNEDTAPHTIVTDKDAVAEIKSTNLNKGDSFEFNFTTVGLYPYHCSVHPSMTGVIQVTP